MQGGADQVVVSNTKSFRFSTRISWEPPTGNWRDSIATGECTDTANSDARGRFRYLHPRTLRQPPVVMQPLRPSSYAASHQSPRLIYSLNQSTRRAVLGGPPRQGERGDVRLGADAGREHLPDEVDVYRLAGVCRRRQVDGRRDHAVQLVARRLRQDRRRLCDADRVCPRPPARPPCVPRAADGVLPGEQRGVGDAVSAAGARRRRQAGRHHRL